MSNNNQIKILVVDDDTFLRGSIVAYLEDSDFMVIEAENGRIGLDRFRNENPDVVLLDLRMPEMDGLTVLPLMVKEAPLKPVVIVSGMGTMQDSIEALRLGAWDYITKPIHDMAFLEHAISRALERSQMMQELNDYRKGLEKLVTQRTDELNNKQALLSSLINSLPDQIYYKDNNGYFLGCNRAYEDYVGSSEAELMSASSSDLSVKQSFSDAEKQILNQKKPMNSEQWLNYPDGRRARVEITKTPYFGPDEKIMGLIEISRDITERIEAEEEHRRSAEKIQKTLVQTIQAVSLSMEKRDPYTSGHQQRVSTLSIAIAEELDLPHEQIEGLGLGSLIHDIGKIYVPAEILNRPGVISELEFSIIKSHAQVGYDIIKDVDFPWPVNKMILQHHERLDGSGYPNGLTENEIILEAKIIAVADVVEAMASHRPYRIGLGIDAALDEIKTHSGKYYDTDVVAACVHLFKEKNYSL